MATGKCRVWQPESTQLPGQHPGGSSPPRGRAVGRKIPVRAACRPLVPEAQKISPRLPFGPREEGLPGVAKAHLVIYHRAKYFW